jgi:hypothetical protein
MSKISQCFDFVKSRQMHIKSVTVRFYVASLRHTPRGQKSTADN